MSKGSIMIKYLTRRRSILCNPEGIYKSDTYYVIFRTSFKRMNKNILFCKQTKLLVVKAMAISTYEYINSILHM